MSVTAAVAGIVTEFTRIDLDLYRTLQAPGSLEGLVRVLATGLPLVLVVAVAALFLVPWTRARRERRAGAVLATAAASLGLLVNQPLAYLVARPRPYVAHPRGAHLLITPSPDPSFPSDHATAGFAIAAAVWAYDRVAGTILMAVAAVLALSRVVAGTHYPSDVLGGAVVGVLVVLVLLVAPIRRRVGRVAEVLSMLWGRILSWLRGLGRALGAPR